MGQFLPTEEEQQAAVSPTQALHPPPPRRQETMQRLRDARSEHLARLTRLTLAPVAPNGALEHLLQMGAACEEAAAP